MTAYRSEAFVIGVKNWGEADKLVTLFTKERGKVSCLAFGCRRPRSPLAAALQLFNRLEIAAVEGNKLDTLQRADILAHPQKLSADLTAIAYGSFVAELTGELFPEGVADTEVFRLLGEIWDAFEVRHPRLVALAAAWQLLALGGLASNWDTCAHCGALLKDEAVAAPKEGGALCGACSQGTGEKLAPAARELLKELSTLDWRNTPTFSVKRDHLLTVEKTLLASLTSFLGRPIKSLDFIRQL